MMNRLNQEGMMNTETIQKQKEQQNREACLMAHRDPWLVWRLRALELGYIPPLLPGKVTPEMVKLLSQEEEYDVQPLLDHTEKVVTTQRHTLAKRLLMTILAGLLLVMGLTYSYSFRDTSTTNFPLLSSLFTKADLWTGKR